MKRLLIPKRNLNESLTEGLTSKYTKVFEDDSGVVYEVPDVEVQYIKERYDALEEMNG